MAHLFPPAIWKISYRYLVRHLRQSLMMVLGVALGVAVAVSIDVANQSAAEAFRLSTQALAGKATHQILGGPLGLEEQVYAQFKGSGLAGMAAPMLSSYVLSPQLGGRPFLLLGLDPFSDTPFRDYLSHDPSVNFDQLVTFLTEPGAVFISRELALQNNLQPGDPLTIVADGRARQAVIAGWMEAGDDITRRQLNAVILADIATAQEITGRIGWIDSIDLILPENDSDQMVRIDNWLPKGTQLVVASSRQGSVEEMTAAFQLNLSALSLLALLVGLFLIYNTMTFAVVQRRPLYGIMRSLGITRREIFGLVLGEAFLVGLLGSIAGIALGVLLSRETVRLVSQTIEDLFYTTTVRSVALPWISLAKGAALGIFATILAAVFPAVEASTSPPHLALQRSGLEKKSMRNIYLAAAGAVVVFLAGLLLFLLDSESVPLGFAGTFLIVMAAAMLAGLLMSLLLRGFSPVLGVTFGLIGKMAPRNLVKSLSRTSIAVTALMIAVAVSIGIGIMIESFRYTVQVWLGETLQGDIYITAPSLTAASATVSLDAAAVAQMERFPGVKRLDTLRTTTVESMAGPVVLDAVNNQDTGQERLFLSQEVDDLRIWAEMLEGGIIVSEPLARRLGLISPGSSLLLLTQSGWQDFPVLGVYYEYSSTTGRLMMASPVYQRFWEDFSVTAAAVRLEDGVDADRLAAELEQDLVTGQALNVRPNREIRAEVMRVFDRTFAITYALRILATLVAFIGILNTLLLLTLEKQREMGILRALGLTGRQLWKLVMLETGLMGLIAGLLAAPTGYMLAYILVYVINRRSFGWTLLLTSQPEIYVQAILTALGAALLAGIYPAYRLVKMQTVEAIRYE